MTRVATRSWPGLYYYPLPKKAARIVIEVPGPPQPYRERQAPVRGGRTHSYRRPQLVRWQEAVAWAAKIAMGGKPPLEGPIRLEVTFYLPMPKRMLKADRALAERDELFHIKRPDRTNFLKAFEDAVTGIVWLDDAQVCRGEAFKRYSPDPRTVAEVSSCR